MERWQTLMSEINSAMWIWENESLEEVNQHVYFRRELSVGKPVKSIHIQITASDIYQLYLNDEFIGRGPSPCTPQYQYYDKYDITSQNGTELCFAVHAYNIGQKTDMVTAQNQGLPAMLFFARVECEDGEVKEYFSDEEWKTIMAPSYFRDYIRYDTSRISKWGGYKEVFVSPNEPEGWKQSGFCNADWKNAVVVTKAKTHFINLVPREIPFLFSEKVYPIAIEQVEPYRGTVTAPEKILLPDAECAIIDASVPGSFPSLIVDFGKEVVGYLEIELKGSYEGNMCVWYGESLDLMRVDTLIMNGKWQVYSPFRRRAFRYIKLSFNNCMDMIEVKNIRLNQVHYPYEQRGNFECSNEMLNKIWNTSVLTVKLGSQEHYEDSIWREEMQWLADARVMALVNYWVFGDSKLPAKSIRQFFRIQKEDGIIPAAGPQRMEGPTMDFSAHFVLMILEYYEYTGDKKLLEETFPKLLKLMQRFELAEDDDGLLTQKEGVNWSAFLDWAFIDKREKSTAVNCFYHKALLTFVKIATILGECDVTKWVEKANKLRATIQQKMYNPVRGLYADCLTRDGLSVHYSQQTNLIAVYCGVVPDGTQKSIIQKVYDSNDIETIKGAFLLSFVIDMLFEYDFSDRAMEMMEDFWGEMILRGATTWWETFNRATPHSATPFMFSKNCPTYLIEYIPVSLCHGWGAGPAMVLEKNVLGIKPYDKGFEKVSFDPYTQGLTFCNGTIPTPFGDINVAWKKDDNGQVSYKISKPECIEVIVNQRRDLIEDK